MARMKMYVIMAGVMRAKWIDPKDIHDKPDVLFSLPTPPADEVVAPVKVENPKILMVADEPGGPRHPVDRETGKPFVEEKPVLVKKDAVVIEVEKPKKRRRPRK